MTNVERNEASIREIDEMCKSPIFRSDGGEAADQIMTIGLLEDISRSLASIADSLERSASRPREPLSDPDGYETYCPNCGSNAVTEEHEYCPDCGQRLKWQRVKNEH